MSLILFEHQKRLWLTFSLASVPDAARAFHKHLRGNVSGQCDQCGWGLQASTIRGQKATLGRMLQRLLLIDKQSLLKSISKWPQEGLSPSWWPLHCTKHSSGDHTFAHHANAQRSILSIRSRKSPLHAPMQLDKRRPAYMAMGLCCPHNQCRQGHGGLRRGHHLPYPLAMVPAHPVCRSWLSLSPHH